jgi:hypothetical protein
VKGSTRSADVTIGLDLGDKRSHACLLGAGGHVIDRRTISYYVVPGTRFQGDQVRRVDNDGDGPHGPDPSVPVLTESDLRSLAPVHALGPLRKRHANRRSIAVTVH